MSAKKKQTPPEKQEADPLGSRVAAFWREHPRLTGLVAILMVAFVVLQLTVGVIGAAKNIADSICDEFSCSSTLETQKPGDGRLGGEGDPTPSVVINAPVPDIDGVRLVAADPNIRGEISHEPPGFVPWALVRAVGAEDYFRNILQKNLDGSFTGKVYLGGYPGTPPGTQYEVTIALVPAAVSDLWWKQYAGIRDEHGGVGYLPPVGLGDLLGVGVLNLSTFVFELAEAVTALGPGILGLLLPFVNITVTLDQSSPAVSPATA